MNAREQRMRTVLGNRLGGLRIIAEALHLRHNVSAILRSAESFGVHDVHLIQPEKSKFSSAARGSERWLRIHIHSSIEECIQTVRAQGYQIWVADIDDQAQTAHSVSIEKPIAILMGTELTGVSAKAKSLADGCIYVPMKGFTQSLNVSVAAACILHTLSHRLDQKNNVLRLDASTIETQVQDWKNRDKEEKGNLKKKMVTIEGMPEVQDGVEGHSH